MKQEELLYRLALPLLPGIGLITAHQLIQAAGSASVLFEERKTLKERIPELPDRILQALDAPDVLRLCEAELRFAEKNHITCLTALDEAYPSRLRECNDAPLVLFYRGTADLNRRHIISMVGTRNATEYGKDICLRFLKELQALLPDVLVVSGLAYGIDIHAHRAALQYGLDTVGVLAQTNYGGVLEIAGIPVGRYLENYPYRNAVLQDTDGSCMIVIVTDAPLDARNLERLAKRGMMGLSRTGGIASNGSGDYVIAVSTAPENLIDNRSAYYTPKLLHNEAVSPLFEAAIEATAEALWNSLFAAETMTGSGITVEALPVERILPLFNKKR